MSSIKLELIKLAMVTNHELTELAANVYVENLSDLPQDQVIQAIRGWVKKERFFPAISDLRKNLCADSQTPREKADVVANRIWDAIARFGWNNPEKAKAYIGELGWKTVEMAGGWVGMCETSDMENKNIIIAQTRDLAMAAQSSYNVDRNKELPEASKDGVFRISNMINTIKQNLLN
jgi:hypothetical protein